MVAGRAGSLEVVGSALGNVRFGSKADIVAPPTNVRFIPESGHRNSLGKCRFVPKADINRRFKGGSDNTERQTDSPLFGVSHQLGQNILNSQQVGCRTKCFVRGAENLYGSGNLECDLGHTSGRGRLFTMAR